MLVSNIFTPLLFLHKKNLFSIRSESEWANILNRYSKVNKATIADSSWNLYNIMFSFTARSI